MFINDFVKELVPLKCSMALNHAGMILSNIKCNEKIVVGCANNKTIFIKQVLFAQIEDNI